MQSRAEDSVRAKMEELRLVCDKEISIQTHRLDTAVSSFKKSLDLIKAKGHDTAQTQAKIGTLKAQLREVEDDLVKALAVKTRKEAKRMATMDTIAATKARIEEIKTLVEDRRARTTEYATIISQQIDVLDCDPLLNATEELISELNKNNGLFKFVRTMREKFQEAAGCGTFPQVMHLDEDLSTISVSASVPSVSTDSRGESPTIQKELQAGETNRYPKKVNKGREGKPALMSPASASYLRRSPRFKIEIYTGPIT
ncbi:hypothetical protein RJ639_045447 [Escallonia herrerae]|uniref:Kinetochore protein SPC25 n=1 Tax=Escallonia herrerae TaxID=1293975 RepID=A0AA89AYR7_9ASTE|nr:hypothetical protein RJ639_045447 [Escallonia herrerae]